MAFDNSTAQALENQLCFPLYAASRLVTRLYQPLLDEYKLTYPQYVVLLILWQHEGITVGEIGTLAILNNNTLTPILKRMEQNGLIERKRDEWDERKILVYLTPFAKQLKSQLACLPSQLIAQVDYDAKKADQLKSLLNELVDVLNS